MKRGCIVWHERNGIMHGKGETGDGVPFQLVIERDSTIDVHIEIISRGSVILTGEYEVQESEIRDFIFDEMLTDKTSEIFKDQEYDEYVKPSSSRIESYFTHAYEKMLRKA